MKQSNSFNFEASRNPTFKSFYRFLYPRCRIYQKFPFQVWTVNTWCNTDWFWPLIWIKPFLSAIKSNILILSDCEEFEFDILSHENWNHVIQKRLQLIETNLIHLKPFDTFLTIDTVIIYN